MQISALLLVVIVAIGSIGVNILSYCCNHKEVAIFTSVDYANGASSHYHSSHSHALLSHHAADDNCCSKQHVELQPCCLADHSHIDADNAEEQCHGAQHCTKNDFMQLKPVKTTDYTIAFCALQPIIIQLFDFIPEVETNTTPRFSNDALPPGYCWIDILPKNALILI